MNSEIIAIGEELLSGDSDIIDTNSIYITQQLAKIGMRVLYKTTVGDDEARITDVIRIALTRADVIITSGGLGPTVDDMTRQGVANAVERPLEFRQALLDEIAAKFVRFGVRMSDNNRVQAMLPDGALVMANGVGTAPGFIVDLGNKVILSVPGVPREMKHLMELHVLPYLAEKYGTGFLKVRVLRTAGIGESLLDESIGEFEKLENPTVGLAAHSGQTDIRIYGRAKTEAEADALIAEVEQQIRARVSEHIFGVDKEPLEGAFVAQLRAIDQKVALFEIGTEGKLRRRLERVEDGAESIASAALFASYDLAVASLDDNAHYRNNSAEIVDFKTFVEETANRIRQEAQAGLAIVVMTQPNGTAIALCSALETRSRTYGYGGAEAGGPEWAAGWALSMGWHMLRVQSGIAAS